MKSFLESRLETVNRSFFRFPDLPSIRWSRGRVRPRYRKLTFGTYDFRKNEIRIHPLLKRSAVPDCVLDYVLFHELLHYEDRERLRELSVPAALSPFSRLRKGGRRLIHNRHFHNREDGFPGRDEACLWMKRFVRGEIHLPAQIVQENKGENRLSVSTQGGVFGP